MVDKGCGLTASRKDTFKFLQNKKKCATADSLDMTPECTASLLAIILYVLYPWYCELRGVFHQEGGEADR